MSVSLAILIVYMLALILSSLVAFITLIIWFFSKSKDESANVLLISASICAALGLASLPVIDYVDSRHEIPRVKNSSAKDVSYVTRADMAANKIEKGQAGDLLRRQYPNFLPLMDALELSTRKAAFDSTASFFDKLPKAERQNFAIVIRETIYKYSAGKKWAPLINQLKDRNFQNTSLPAVQSQVLALLEHMDQAQSLSEIEASKAAIEEVLPDGWYRFALMDNLYKKAEATEQEKALQKAHDLKVWQRGQRLLWGYCVVAILVIGGVVAIIFLVRDLLQNSRPTVNEPALADSSFRMLYSQALVIYYVQFALGFPLGMISALMPNAKESLKEHAALVTLLELALNIVLFALTTKFMLCKKLGLSFFPEILRFFQGKVTKMIAWGIGGFFVLRTFGLIYTLTLLAVFHDVPHSNNTVDHQILDLAINPNIVNIFLLWIAVALLGPLYEELTFRGLLYSVARRRLGIVAATILSAAIFAAFHLDPASFPSHFAVGVGLAIIYQRTGSLLSCYITHACWNTSVMLLSWLFA